MNNEQRTKLLWCGVVVLIIGVAGLVFYLVEFAYNFQNYLNALRIDSQLPSEIASRLSSEWLFIVVPFAVFIVLWCILIGIGLYIVKQTVKKETIDSDSSSAKLEPQNYNPSPGLPPTKFQNSAKAASGLAPVRSTV